MTKNHAVPLICLICICLLSTSASAANLVREPLQIYMANHGGLINPISVVRFQESGVGDLMYIFNRNGDDEPDIILHNITDTSYEIWFQFTPVGPTSGGYVGSVIGLYYNGSFITNNPAGYYSGSGQWPGSMKYAATITYAPVIRYPDISISVPESNPLGREPLQIFMINHGNLLNPDKVVQFPESGDGDLIYSFDKFEDEPDLLLHNITDTSYEVWFVYTPVGPTSGDYVGPSTAFYYNGSFVANNPAGYYSGSGRWPGSMKYAATITYAKKPVAGAGGIADINGILLNKTISPQSIKAGTDSRVSIIISNTGQFPIHDIEISDTVPPEIHVTSGKTQYAIPGVIGPGEIRTISYTIMPQKAGVYVIDPAKIMYADKEGNYHQILSNKDEVDVIEPLIRPSTDPLIDWISSFRSWFP